MIQDQSSNLVESHLPCDDCGSSDALSKYSDGHTYCFSCQSFRPAFTGDDHRHDSGQYTYEYLPWRGVSKETMQLYNVKTKIDEDGEPFSIGYPYPNGSYKIRDLSKKEFYTKGDISQAGLFGQDKFSIGGHKYVTITEGELDALSLYQSIKGPVVSVRSSSSAVRDCSNVRAWLNSYERIYLAFDADSP